VRVSEKEAHFYFAAAQMRGFRVFQGRKFMILTADGIRLYAEKIGDGPTSIVVPQRIYLREYFEQVTEGQTAIFYDPRNRGQSETVNNPEKLSRGIVHDAEDLEAIRLHFGLDRMAILTHSYFGIAALLYASAYPEHVTRMVLIGPTPPDPYKVYPPELRSSDGTLEKFNQEFANLRLRIATLPQREKCRETWALLRRLYVADAENADALRWQPCDIANEAGFMLHFTKHIQPSLAASRMSEERLSRIRMPILVVHGRKDRSAPYGGGRDWAQQLPNARLLTISEAAHVPWIEAPEIVYAAIRTFIRGSWPSDAENIGQY
jgi:proline iminopeptidase